MNTHNINQALVSLAALLLIATSLRAADKPQAIPGYPEAGIQSLSDYVCLSRQEIPKNIDYNICVKQERVDPATLGKSNEFSIITQGVAKLFEALASGGFEVCSETIIHQSPDLSGSLRQLRDAIRFKETSSGAYFPRYLLIHIVTPDAGFQFPYYSYGYPNYYFSPAHDSTTNRWARHLSIAVNANYLANDEFAFGHDPYFWAAVTLPAFLSNLGRTDRPFSSEAEQNSALMKCVLNASREGVRP